MRILHVVQGYSPAIGGTEFLIQRVSEELVQRFGDEVVVFTTDCYNTEAFYTPALPRLPTGWEERNGVRVRRFPVRRALSRIFRRPQAVAYRLGVPYNDRLRALAGGPLAPGLRHAIAEWPADVIAAASFPLLHMFDALEAAHLSGRPCVLTGCLHPDDRWGFERRMIYRAINAADAYVALTPYEADFVVGRGAAPERVHTVGAGVDADAYEGLTTDEAKWRLGFDRRPLVGFIGQIAGHKGVDTVLRAMPHVWREEPDVNLLIAGGATLFVPEVERTMREWPPDFRRRARLVVGFPEERKRLLFGAIDVLAHPSGYESFGITNVEAWAAAKPVIGVRRGAVMSMVDEGRDGLLVDYQDEGAVARAILALVRDPARARAMGEAGRAKVRDRYTWERVATAYRRIYEQVVSRRRQM